MTDGNGNPPTELWVIHITGQSGTSVWFTRAARQDAYEMAVIHRRAGDLVHIYRYQMAVADQAAGTHPTTEETQR